ncbi:tellurite resistance/C4-dicarboxylate transporter family protein [Candidatus Methylocalor cossyra]|uniref:tellurite resistance/C4-dicarboxylate transporter family protein n=1 Tax=Candidatus Methylocalor cossyra TaxID=3108543 RepID=UPI0032B0F0FC
MIRHLPPGSFAPVMATGIVSIAAHAFDDPWIVRTLFRLNQALYAVLWLLTLVRCLAYPTRVKADLGNPKAAPGFLTIVAGTCLLGSQYVLFEQDYGLGWWLWLAGLGLWGLLLYAVFTALILAAQPTRLACIDGSWLLTVVATQSVAVLGVLLAPTLPEHRVLVLFAALCLYLLGCVLYLLITALIVGRLLLVPLTARDWVPSYWINMGAAAITVLAGSTLASHASLVPWLEVLIPFLKGCAVLFWAVATWWIPLILILGFWRYVCQNFPIRYELAYWSVVFPLGMYSAGTHQLAKTMDIAILHPLARVFFSASLSAWLVVFIGLLRTILALGRAR